MITRSSTTNLLYKKAVVVGIMVIVALIHLFRVGSYLDGALYTLYYSYFSDIIVPFGMYFLLGINETTFRLLADWRLKAILVFAAASSTEIMQAFGVKLLGNTYDPLDIVMFGVGVLLAVVFDRFIFWRFLPFWRTGIPPAEVK